MKQVWQEQLGDPREVFTVREAVARAPGPDELRVAVEAAPILPMDALRARGLYPLAQDLPGVPGSVGVGRVIDGPRGWEGARVHLPVRAGSWAEVVTVPTEGCLRLPDSADPVQACLLRIDGLSAQAMLTGLSRGSWVLIDAATGGVGHFAVQLASRMGVGVVAVVRRTDRMGWVKALGADVVLLDGPDLAERVRESTREPIHRALDGVGGEATERLGACLADGGRVLHYGAASRQGPRLRVADAIFRGVLLQGFWLQRIDRDRGDAETGRILTRLLELGLEGAVDGIFPLPQLHAAVDRHLHPDRFGRVVLTGSAARFP